MSEPFFKVRLHLLPTSEGGRKRSIFSNYRPNWNLGNTWLGEPTLNDGSVFLEDCDELAPGATALARIEPVASEFWGRVVPGARIAMQEGSRVVGYATVIEIASRPDYWTPEVAIFVDQAWQFCGFAEKASDIALEQRVAQLRERLLELYTAATRLPLVELPDAIDAGPTPAPPNGAPGFDTFNFYWEVFDPYEESAPVSGALSDDVLDIYGDLKRGLDLWDKGGTTERSELRIAAIWEWRFHFEIHWGRHAIDALRALHRASGQT